jgi:hypothetical protein
VAGEVTQWPSLSHFLSGPYINFWDLVCLVRARLVMNRWAFTATGTGTIHGNESGGHYSTETRKSWWHLAQRLRSNVNTSVYVSASTQMRYTIETPYIPIEPYNFDIWDNILSKPNTTYISIYIFINQLLILNTCINLYIFIDNFDIKYRSLIF